ncbi:MAG: hypothetical protein LBF61_05600 [Azoarcus sp.]|jgi:hypothetical protein|nr:hypothetical protein [Azoarcus sp.]
MKLPAIFPLPPLLRRPLLFCVAAVIAASSMWVLAASIHAEQEAAARRARTVVQTLETRLMRSREAETRHAALVQRVEALSAMAGEAPDSTEWERLAGRLAEDTRIANIVLHAQSEPMPSPAPAGIPSIGTHRLRIDANLLHEEAVLALNAIVVDIPARFIPSGCALRRKSGATAAIFTLRVRCEFDWTALAPPVERPQ